MGRAQKESRLCVHCQEIENENHVLFDCPCYYDVRKIFVDEVNAALPSQVTDTNLQHLFKLTLPHRNTFQPLLHILNRPVSKFSVPKGFPSVRRPGTLVPDVKPEIVAGSSRKMNAEFRVVPVGGCGIYQLHCWSVSGFESCVTVKCVTDKERFAFDIGQTTRASLNCSHVFITHGHVDHCGSLPKHVSQREMTKMPPATYYCPPEIETPLRKICQNFAIMAENESPAITSPKIVPIAIGATMRLPGNRIVKPFVTTHRCASQGYLIYTQIKVMRPEFNHLAGPEIGQLVQAGTLVYDTELVPEIAYTGDTTFEAFSSPDYVDVLRSRILITEATYIDDRQTPQKAKDRGHMHLMDIARNAEMFRNVGALVLVHLSDRYNCGQAQYWLERSLPPWLLKKTWVPTLMKDCE